MLVDPRRCLVYLLGASLVANALRFDIRKRDADDDDDDDDDEAPLAIPIRNFDNQLYTVHVTMGSSGTAQWFNFSLATTHAYTAVAGTACKSCSTSGKSYNSSLSGSYIAPPANASTVSFDYNGKTVSGVLATENCSLKESGGSDKWWWYNNQKVLVAGSGSDSSSFGAAVGVAGFGQSGAGNVNNSIVGEYLSAEPGESFTYGVALSGTSSTGTTDAPLEGDSSGGYMHLNAADPSFYTGTISTATVVDALTVNSNGQLPYQLGSYDWTIQVQSFVLKTPKVELTGGAGTYATLEMAYPYIMLPQALAYQFYQKIDGAQQYVISSTATTVSGQTVYSDPNALSWSIPCSNSGVILYVNFNGVSIPIQSTDLFTSIGGVCVGNVRGWADPNIQIAILGSAFFRNAYVVFTAAANNQLSQNSVGVANRLITQQSANSSNKGAIIGGAVGGAVFLIIVALVVFYFVRKWKKQGRSPPSAAFMASAAAASTFVNPDGTYYTGSVTAKSPAPSSSAGWFAGAGSTAGAKRMSSYVADPWIEEKAVSPGPSTTEQGVVVTPWTPNAPGEQAFLSPTGSAAVASLPYAQQQQQQQQRAMSVYSTNTSAGPASPGPGALPMGARPTSMSGYSQATSAGYHHQPPTPVALSASPAPISPAGYAQPLPQQQQQYHPQQQQSAEYNPYQGFVGGARPLPPEPGSGMS